MSKRYPITVCLLCLLSMLSISAQTPTLEPLEKTRHPNFVRAFNHAPNGQYVYVHTQIATHEDSTHQYIIKVIKPYVGVNNETSFFIPKDTSCRSIDIYYDDNLKRYINTYFCHTENIDFQGYIIELDTSLNIIYRKKISENTLITLENDWILNHNNNIVIASHVRYEGENIHAVLSEFDRQGNLVQSLDFIFPRIQKLIQLPNKNYRLIDEHGQIAAFDTAFNLQKIDTINTFDMSMSLTTNPPPYSNDIWVGGLSQDGKTGAKFDVSSIAKLSFPTNAPPNLTLIFKDTIPQEPDLLGTVHNFDYIDTTHMYLAHATTSCFVGLHEDCINHLVLYSVSSDGTLNWFKKIGG